MRTYLYKLTSDRGGSPCAPRPRRSEAQALTLSLCKPAIRRTAQVGDRIIGVTSRALQLRERYPANAVIYAARVTRIMDFQEYYRKRSVYRSRPDCVYVWDAKTGTLEHDGTSLLHRDPRNATRDLGSFPWYRNARILLSEDFRYFGRDAVVIPERLLQLRLLVHSTGQGHRVIEESSPVAIELDVLWKELWSLHSHTTPKHVFTETHSAG